MSEQNIASATEAAIGHGIIQGLAPLGDRSPADVRYDCLRLVLMHGGPIGKTATEYAAELADFVLNGRAAPVKAV